MSPRFDPAHSRWLMGLAALAAASTLALAASVGQGDLPGSGYQFVGRFHPLVVHLPIGVLLLLAMLELLTLRARWRSLVDPLLPIVQLVALATSVVAFTLGVLLAGAGGYSDELLNGHKRFVLAAVVLQCAALCAYIVHLRRASEPARQAYRVALGACVLALGVGAHFGGSLTHGQGYLVRYAPPWLKGMLGNAEPDAKQKTATKTVAPSADPLVFEDVVAPVLDQYCVSCHGPEKSKAELRLDSYEALKKGGESGAVVVPGSPEKSSLVKLIELPEAHDERMPPEGKPAPTQAERELIAWWILSGARSESRVREVLPPSAVIELLKTRLAAPVGDETQAEPSASARAAQASEPAASGVRDGDETATKTDDREQAAPQPQLSPEPLVLDKSAGGAADEQQVFSILASRCASCHGSKKQKGRLRVDSLAALRRGGKAGAAVVPGLPQASLLLQRVRLPLNHDEHMPPKNKPQLSALEIQLLSTWIEGLAGSAGRANAVADSPRSTVAAEVEPAAASAEDTSVAGGYDPEASEANEAEASSLPIVDLPALSAAQLEQLPLSVRLYSDVVEPLLHTACGECHIGDPVMGDLSVASYGELMQSGTVVPGQPAQSELLARVLLPEDDDDRMPPEGMEPLSPAQVGTLRFWIQQGAEAEGKWARQDLPNAVRHALLAAQAPQVVEATRAGQAPAEERVASAELRHGGCAACAMRSRPGSLPLLATLLVSGFACWRRCQRRS